MDDDAVSEVVGSDTPCEQLGTKAVGSVMNRGIREWEILKVYNPIEGSRNSTELICEGEAMFDTGPRETIQMRNWKDEDDRD